MTQKNNNLTNKPQAGILANDTAGTNKRQPTKMRKRVPMVEQSRLASVEAPHGYVHRWVNDADGRILKAQKAGYEHVDRKGSIVKEKDDRFQDPDWKTSLMSQPVGGGVTAYLMRQKKEFWEEDQAAKQKRVDITENQTLQKRIVGVPDGQVTGEVSISSTNEASEKINRENIQKEVTAEVIQKLKNEGVI